MTGAGVEYEKPKKWVFVIGGFGDLCPSCHTMYETMKNDFMTSGKKGGDET